MCPANATLAERTAATPKGMSHPASGAQTTPTPSGSVLPTRAQSPTGNLAEGLSCIQQQRHGSVTSPRKQGIEPHPGPRYLHKNVNSVQGDGKLFQMLQSIQREHTRTPITAVFVQDHRLPAARNAEMQRIARGMNMLAIATHAPPHPTTGACYGGTMIVIPHDAIELEKGETIHDATRVCHAPVHTCRIS